MLLNLVKKTKRDYYKAKFSSLSGDKKKYGSLSIHYVANAINRYRQHLESAVVK